MAYRLDQIERRLETGLAHMDDRLDKVQGSIASLAFVRQDVYQSEQASLGQRITGLDRRLSEAVAAADQKQAARSDDVEQKADRAASLSLRAIGFSITSTLAVLGTFVAILQAIK